MTIRKESAGSNEQLLPAKPPDLRENVSLAIFLAVCGVLSVCCLFRMNGLVYEVLFIFRMSVLCAASVRDFRERCLNHGYEILILASGFFSLTSVSDFLWKAASAAAVFLILALLYGRKPKRFMGGADIRMITALFFALGPYGMLRCFFVMTVLLLLTIGLYALLKLFGKNCGDKVPLIPYITFGVLFNCLFN